MMVETCVVLRNGLIVDGTGAAPFLGEVVLRQARTASVIPAGATGWTVEPPSVVDCSGKVVAPGFIDAHSHSDLQILEHRTEKLLQGVTSEVVGNCGFSTFPSFSAASTSVG